MILTREQVTAATSTDPRVFVEAAPGSGKTAVAAERFGYLRFIARRRLPVVTLSFTRSATGELRARILKRWGAAALRWPHRVMTFDGLHREIVEYLLRAGHITWLGGQTALTVLDTWRGQSGARLLRGGSSWRRVACLRSTSLGSKGIRVREDTYGYSRKEPFEELLKTGMCTHDEVRQVLRDALADMRLRQIVVEYLARTCGTLIVDEFFDADELDIAVIGAACSAGSNVTIIGDPWQAIYQFRGARPDLAREFSIAHGFVHYPINRSFRFETASMRAFASSLRQGLPCNLPRLQPVRRPTEHLARLYSTLARRGAGHYAFDALSILEISPSVPRDEQTEALAPVLEKLASPSDDAELGDAFSRLRRAAKQLGSRRLLPNLRLGSQHHKQLQDLSQRLAHDSPLVPGMTVHQAKGREWNTVGVALAMGELNCLRRGLRVGDENNRLTYVALTRARRDVVGL